MAERRTIGQILMGFGRLTEADVEKALQYQEQHGGYFGEALLGLGLVAQEELEWSLASQFDLPYVFPEPDSIDPDAAGLVTPEWALANLTLPIMRTSDAVTVIVDSPIKTGAVDELERKTELRIELALASATRIRELIRKVYAVGDSEQDQAEAHAPLELPDLVAAALEQGSGSFGISARGRRATGWFQDRATVRRRFLTSSWMEELERLVAPPPSEQVNSQDRAVWTAYLTRKGMSHPVEVRFMAASGGTEYVFSPVELRAKIHERFPPPGSGVLSEVKLLVRSGSARFAVTTEPASLSTDLIPHLPALFLDSHWRAVHVGEGAGAGEESEEVFRVEVPHETTARAEALEALRAFHFDAVTADLGGPLVE